MNKIFMLALMNRTNAYIDSMTQFFAMPGASGKARLKIEKPATADGVMIRRKTSAWASGDTEGTGTLIANITDDSNYKDANEWYDATGLTNGTPYYFKAFPYKNSEYNRVIGVNESTCTAGALVSEYTADSISGTTVNDTSGNGYNGTASSITYGAGVVGNKFNFDAKSDVITLPTAQAIGNADQSYCCWFNVATIGTRNIIIYKDQGAEIELEMNSGGYLVLGNASAGRNITSTDAFSVGTDYFVVCKFAASTKTLTLKVRAKADASWKTYSGVASGILTSQSNGFNLSHYSGASLGLLGMIDQFRYFNHVTSNAEDDAMFNGGNGC